MDTPVLEDGHDPIRVLLVDDHVLVRQGIRALLHEDHAFEVVGEAEHEKAAVLLTMELNPDIVLLNITLGTSHGLEVAHRLLRICSASRLVVLAGSNDEQLLFDALRIGVHGYLQTTLSIDELRTALRAVYQGERVLGNAQAVTQVTIEFHRLAREQNRLNRGLSLTEVELMRLASKGYTNKEIGKHLFWSEVQVKRKMQDVYRKLQVADRAQAVAEAMRQGLI